jgi:hypothetical protein
MSDGFQTTLIVALSVIVSFLLVAGMTFIVSWGFGYYFSWRLAIGVYFLILLVRVMLGVDKK